MFACQMVVWFCLFSLLGWLFECAYCSVVEKRWCNRGFLFGPVCPIYGAGAVGAILVFGSSVMRAALPPAWAIFLICGIGASCIEWVTSVVMERLFGTVWWDYSDLPLNIKGRVCAPAACLFGACGLVIVYVALPLVDAAVAVVPATAFEVAGLLLAALLACDTTLTICTLTEILDAIEHAQGSFDNRVQNAMDAADDRLRSGADQLRTGAEQLRSGADQLRSGAERGAEKIRETGAEQADRLREIAWAMGARQQHVLHNMRRFRTERLSGSVRRLTETLDAATRRGRRP